MKYSNVEWTIGQLMDLINCNRINLRPPYQRNFIWSHHYSFLEEQPVWFLPD